MVRKIITDASMAASESFDSILHQVKHSCLNFQMQVTPFSAIISLRKSFIKDKSGLPFHVPMIQSHSEATTVLKVNSLETELANYRDKYEKVVEKYDNANKSLNIFEEKIKEQEITIKNLEIVNVNSKAVVDKLNKAFNEKLSKFEKDKKDLVREHNIEVKHWRKELGNMTKNI